MSQIITSGLGSGGGGVSSWAEVTGTTVSLGNSKGYIINNAARVTATLPTNSSFGDVIIVAGKGAGGWKIAQNAGQTIHFLGLDTTAGATGYLESTNRYDCVELICITANTDYLVINAMGNITVV